ncbi:hypothetical protein ACHAWF_007304, partial [Thalassiosira exigua]
PGYYSNSAGATYLFDRKADCCAAWFEERHQECLMGEYPPPPEPMPEPVGGTGGLAVHGSHPSQAQPEANPPPSPPEPVEIRDQYQEDDNHDGAAQSLGSLSLGSSAHQETSASYRDDFAPTTAVLYSESFESGSFSFADPNREYFAWGLRGNGRWEVKNLASADADYESYDGTDHVAAVGGSGRFAVESTLSLTVGGNTHTIGWQPMDAVPGTIEQRGAYVS